MVSTSSYIIFENIVGSFGLFNNFKPASFSVLLPLYVLHLEQQVTIFAQVFLPPFDLGIT